MRNLLMASIVTALIASPVMLGCSTGIGKGSPPKNATTTTNPCNAGDSYDAATKMCTGKDGKTYQPK